MNRSMSLKPKGTNTRPIALKKQIRIKQPILLFDLPKRKEVKEYLVNFIITNSLPLINQSKESNNSQKDMTGLDKSNSLKQLPKPSLFCSSSKALKPYVLPYFKPLPQIIGEKFVSLNKKFKNATHLYTHITNSNALIENTSTRPIHTKSFQSSHSYKKNIENLHKRLRNIKLQE